MRNSEIVIRPFDLCDQAAVRKLILAGLGDHFGFIDESRNPDLDDVWAYYVKPGHTFVVADANGRGAGLVGTGALMWLDERTAQMVRVSVSRDYRRRGIGRAIVAQLVEVARQHGITRVQVETNNDWHDAIGLYLRHGFVEYDRDDESVYLAMALTS